jgi:hypothetical protein
MKSTYQLWLICLIVLVTTASCKKYLDEKPNSNVQVPSDPSELQGLLDNQEVFGYGHTLGLLSADEFYFSPSFYNGSLSKSEQNTYIWSPEIFSPEEISHDWNKAYEQIYYTNIALEGLRTNTSDDTDLDKIKADALFKRALAHFRLAELFAPAYSEANADVALGIPFKLKTDADESITRPTLRECFGQILADLDNAKGLLPNMPHPSARYRASNAAVLALKARILLYMGNWQQSAIAAEAALNCYDSLIDFNSIDTSTRNPFKAETREILYQLKAPDIGGQNALVIGLASNQEGANVDTHLIQSFTAGDLRLPIYFRQRTDKSWGLRFTLTGTRTPFEGISVSEIYLTLAEAQARQGNTVLALARLNRLLVNRYDTAQVPPLPPGTDPQAVLERILAERKKELPFRALRWLDIKRLNVQGRKITQTRNINNSVYTLAPNDLRYALPLPAPTVEKYDLKPNPR